jgi:hypothetical protein
MMLSLLNPRTWLMIGLAAMLALSHGFAYRSGRAAVRADFDAYKTANAEAVAESERFARNRERELTAINRKVTNDYQAEKKLRAADAVAAADALRLFEQAASSAKSDPDSTARSGTDAPFAAIAGECAAALRSLDEHAQGLASTARGLQGYAREVCVRP